VLVAADRGIDSDWPPVLVVFVVLVVGAMVVSIVVVLRALRSERSGGLPRGSTKRSRRRS
jgi:hypothetical protein